MKKIVKEALPLERFTLPRSEALAWAKEKEEPYKAELISDRLTVHLAGTGCPCQALADVKGNLIYGFAFCVLLYDMLEASSSGSRGSEESADPCRKLPLSGPNPARWLRYRQWYCYFRRLRKSPS